MDLHKLEMSRIVRPLDGGWAEIGEIFLQNHVTGYDFPELVDNGGRALLEELKIVKSTFRKKIVSLVNARMLGIGGRPETPTGIQINLEGCSTAMKVADDNNNNGIGIQSIQSLRSTLSSIPHITLTAHPILQTASTTLTSNNHSGSDIDFQTLNLES